MSEILIFTTAQQEELAWQETPCAECGRERWQHDSATGYIDDDMLGHRFARPTKDTGK